MPGSVDVKKNYSGKDRRTSEISTPKKSGDQRTFLPSLIFVLALCFIAYLPVLTAGFVDWDDQDYVINNKLIRSFSNLKDMMVTPVQGNLHPLTMFSLAINHAISGNDPWSYHLVNVLFHLANTVLVFLFVRRLTKKSQVMPVVVAMLFALHPMHVESVAWISERKDVLYGFFFLLGLISYIRYVDEKSGRQYAWCVVWFVLSLASKPSAIIFPFVLPLIDWFRRRTFSRKLITEKLPLVLAAAAVSYYTYQLQVIEGAIKIDANYFGIGKLFFGFYGFLTYMWKMLLPVNLCTFYPYPLINRDLPTIYYLSPLFFLAVVILCMKTFRRFPVITFGFSFTFVTLLPVLQFVLIGSAIVADRYTYIPYIGVFLVIGWLVDRWKGGSLMKAIPYLSLIAVVLTFVSFRQASTWKDSKSLWDQAIRAYPSSNAYLNRAKIYRKEGNNPRTVELLNEAVKLNVNDPYVFLTRGNANYDMGITGPALTDFNQALKLKPDYIDALNSRGALYGSKKMNDSAMADLNRAIMIDSNYAMAYKNRALVYVALKRYNESIADFQKYLFTNPNDANIISTIGVCYQSLGMFRESITQFNRAIAIDPRPVFYLNRSYSWNSLGSFREAHEDAVIAKKGGEAIPEAYAKFYGL